MSRSVFKEELGLAVSVSTAILFFVFEKHWLSDLSSYTFAVLVFLWLFIVMLWSSFAVVRHADSLAVRLGEPYGTLILTLSVICIEIVVISSIMLTGKNNPTPGRDMMFGVLMIAMNGLVGLSLFLGGLRHIEQSYNCQGANAFLAVIIPLAVLGLIVPNYTRSTETGTFSTSQMVFITLATLGLYTVFLVIQTIRHRNFFVAPSEYTERPDAISRAEGDAAVRPVPFHTLLLIANMVPIVLLSKSLGVIVDFGISEAGAPQALGGILLAILVLTPEGIAALRASLADKLQRSINIGLGSALATIGLTVPAVLAIGILTRKTVIIGLSPLDSLLLILTLAVSMVNFSSGRSNIVHGLTHLILFCAFIVLIFD